MERVIRMPKSPLGHEDGEIARYSGMGKEAAFKWDGEIGVYVPVKVEMIREQLADQVNNQQVSWNRPSRRELRAHQRLSGSPYLGK